MEKEPINVTNEETVDALRKSTQHIDDISFKKILTLEGIVTIVYSASLVEKMVLQTMVYIPLANYIHQIHQVSETLDLTNFEDIIAKLNAGQTLLYFHDTNKLLVIDTDSAPKRAITIAERESTMLGPQDAFTESLETNISLIRRRIRSPKLKNEDCVVGTDASTKISIMYMEDTVNQEYLENIRKRIEKINYPILTDISVLKHLIVDNPLSPFPLYYMSVRPDIISQYLIDGRIIVLMDNSQAALVCPTSFFEMFISIEDYYNHWTIATLLRTLRFFGFFLTITITPLYISALTFHPEILPSDLLQNLQESRSKVPFPPLFEVIFIELIIEILREAGSRMPTKIGQTIGIVGGIVIGTAAVEAGLISNILIVLVSTSALLSFLPPFILMSNTSRIIRYIFILSAGLFGLLGQVLAFVWLMIHLEQVKSLGAPFNSIVPRKFTDLFDSLIRLPTALLIAKKGISKSQKK
ncbi:spore germination protein [Lysinibacillus fusiformis]|uniref:spore germination protein n=1 Tax=Lysinibacillus fusiformis TaxID=28031 RepID=UPI001CD9AC89|nr:spore germination protein [Lysinibacillus fusiformis]